MNHVLFVLSQPPWPATTGGRQRAFHLIDGLAARSRVTLLVITREPFPHEHEAEYRRMRPDIELTVVRMSPADFTPAERLQPWAPVGARLGALVRSRLPSHIQAWQSPRVLDALRGIDLSRFEGIWVTRPFMAELMRARGATRFVVDVDNLESIYQARELEQRPFYLSKPLHHAEWFKTWLYERSLARRYWRLAVCKAEDRAFFGPNGHNVFVVPNGVDDCEPSPASLARENRLLFVGTLTYEPNIDAIRYFVLDILPLVRARIPGVQFCIVGRGPVPPALQFLREANVELHVDAPDVTPFFHEATAVVAPIRTGAGTRLKVLEALGRAKALVATSTAVEGIELRPGIDLEIADSPQAFAERCVAVLTDADLRARLSDTGRSRVMEHYRWKQIGERAHAVLTEA